MTIKQRINCQEQYFNDLGHIKHYFSLPQELKTWVKAEDYQKIDSYFQDISAKDGKLFTYLSEFCEFNSIEFIISLREAKNEWEEDGIWHDDGSRKMAFSLSLMNHTTTEGGVLEIRKKGKETSTQIPPFNFGEIIIFKTGLDNFEHKINAVTKGKRLIIAGWCS